MVLYVECHICFFAKVMGNVTFYVMGGVSCLSKDGEIFKGKIWMFLFSFQPGNPTGFGASGWSARFGSTCRLSAIQEPGAFFIFVFPVIYFLHLRFLKTRNRWTNPSSSEQTASQAPCVEERSSPAESCSRGIIDSSSAVERTP